MGKYVFWFVTALTVAGVIIWLNWDSIFWNFLKPTERAGMLPLLSGLITTILTLIVAIASLAIAYKNHLSNSWKPDIRFELCHIDENGVKNRLYNWVISLSGIVAIFYKLLPKALKKTDGIQLMNNPATSRNMIIRVRIKNIGKAEMRFDNPKFDSDTYLTRPVLLEKNGLADENYFSSKVLDLKSGEMVELYYSLTDLQNDAFGMFKQWKAIFNESGNYPFFTSKLWFRIVDAQNHVYLVKCRRRLRIFVGRRWGVSDPYLTMFSPVYHRLNIEQRGRQKVFDMLLAQVNKVDLIQIHKNSHLLFSYLVENDCWTIQDNHYELNTSGSSEENKKREAMIKEAFSWY